MPADFTGQRLGTGARQTGAGARAPTCRQPEPGWQGQERPGARYSSTQRTCAAEPFIQH